MRRFGFAIVTRDTDLLWKGKPREDYIQLLAITDGSQTTVTDDSAEMRRLLLQAPALAGHDALTFAVHALARHLGMSFRALADKSLDTRLMARLVWPPLSRSDPNAARWNQSDLGTLAERAGIRPKGSQKAMKVARGPRPMDEQGIRIQCAAEAALVLRLWDHLEANWPDEQYARREARLHSVAAGVAWRGVGVDLDNLDRFLADDQAAAREARDYLSSVGVCLEKSLGHQAKFRLAEIVRNDLGLDLPVTEKSGVPRVDAETLSQIDHPACKAVVRLNRQRNLPVQVQHHLGSDGRIHPFIDPSSQATGRWSVTRPGLTTWGKRSEALLRDRALFRPSKGYVFFSVDYSAIDVRGLAALSQDPRMVQMLREGSDWHEEMAAAVLGERTRAARRRAKVLSHAVNYNAGPATIAEAAGISLNAATELLAKVSRQLPVLTRWKTDVIAEAKRGEGLVNGWGRLLAPSPGREHTQAPGLVGQSWARDAVAEGLLHLDYADLSQYVVLQVHDEFVFEVPEGIAEDVRTRAVEVMTFERDGVPILCAAGPIADRWDRCYR